ncbi:GMC oxidoreductase [Trametes coccinea BRFM310]|uniref:GMC oxidoreductase n=1 Tax=Trametes coccinea (strain BRFM310) TaxID=1353009 RepID=A0A1Y2J5E2_TRAC3|nr:GMC oxidoreductase [Trametes coccinea BRFM310]
MATPKITPEQFASTQFDYIIVGGGTAGLVLATRLSEDPSKIVGVIEAGDWDPNVNAINIPGLCGSILGNPQYDWAFMSVPQKHANNRPVFQPRGKALGGSSMLNLLGYSRAAAHEYDAIEALGNPGWNWQEFLKYLKKTETTLPPSDIAKEQGLSMPDARYHGDSGPIVKQYPTWFNPLHKSFLDTLEKLGVPRNADPDSGINMGGVTSFMTVDSDAVRTYSASSYYQPNASRQNLFVLTNSKVAKINFREGFTPLLATGVDFITGEQRYTVSARKEVILAAGAFQTPQILELSGIGNKEILSKYGIQTLLDLPAVGENLQLRSRIRAEDHVYVYSIYEIDPSIETVDDILDPEVFARQQELYKSHRGYLSSGLAAVFGYLPAKAFASEEQLAQWKADALAAAKNAPPGLRKQLEIQIDWFLKPDSAESELLPFPGFFPGSTLKREPGKRYSSMVASLLHPLSRGSVHIASTDPAAAPAIDPNYFANSLDLDMLLNAFKFTLDKLYKTGPFGDVVRKLVTPSSEVVASDDALKEYIKNNCGCVYHPLGSASMLPREDGGVVDPQLKVYGTANVRVVDASVIPLEISAHTQATVYAIAEKAADIIKGQ